MKTFSLPWILGWLFCTTVGLADVVLSPSVRDEPGILPTREIVYTHPSARAVQAAGEWDRWAKPVSLPARDGQWVLDIGAMSLPEGRYEFKFIVDGQYEDGANRFFFVDEQSRVARRVDNVLSATIEGSQEIVVYFRRPLPPGTTTRVELEPHLPVERIERLTRKGEADRLGYSVTSQTVSFLFSEEVYGLHGTPIDRVSVAGNFNGWNPAATGYTLRDDDGDGLWDLHVSAANMKTVAENQGRILFKFVINGDRWLEPPAGAINATPEGGEGAVNLELDLAATEGGAGLRILTRKPIPLHIPVRITLLGASEKPIRRLLAPGAVLDDLASNLPMGVTLDRERLATTYRVFAPRASSVDLALYPGVEHTRLGKPITPSERYPMRRVPDGAWELTLLGLDTGKSYGFFVDGPTGEAEGFHAESYIGDPYAKAAAHAENTTLVIDSEKVTPYFAGWTDQDWMPPAPQDALIYETHVRHFTQDISSRVPLDVRGLYEGILATRGTGAGLDHLKALGVNYIQLMPTGEFGNGTENRHDWGYATAFFFAPEASYARAPLEGSQYYEFKHLVNELHRQGFGVILDVVYNHIGSPNVFHFLDKKYYFRMNPDLTLCNYSGCGNDVRTEAPMMRRLIVENVLYWMREFHIDGFRFDLAELIDLETLRIIEQEAKALNPNVLIISEPWSFRGNHKAAIKGTQWSAWNDEFREQSKRFVLGHGDRDHFKKTLVGSVDLWTAHPLQAVNYTESHDDRALADELSLREDKDGSTPSPDAAAINRMSATALFTSLGMIMISEGQDWLRSKRGISNTYNRGDEYNSLRWDEREDPARKPTMDYYIALSKLRASPEGKSFRPEGPVGPDYYQWIEPTNSHALGYIVNVRREQPGAAWIVLLNAATEPVNFQVALPPGNWVRVGDGDRISLDGLSAVVPGGRSLTIPVPPRRAHIYLSRTP